ncbi:ABC transporter ATP-binding protein [Aquincola sp. S2]|uniref:ABC transporter ATP-binding protein n=1 Tax=Pseudaquabacterium terrae TaxID=2732868 RepID=A0ABX2EGG8_9BURK|nr:ABC transporter ATP-binding protein [Aquabacterium terrae]NRF67718.1 ABC transporter ATP-binding protein [Aquabacterium terrae]
MLDVSGLTVHYGKHRALDAVALALRPAELVVMLGANGAGKSTLLRALGGMLKPAPGARATLDGHDLLALPPHRLVEAGVALVPEGRGLFPDLSVQDNLRLGALPPRARAGERRNFERLLSLFPRLAERLKQAVGTMSGGEQQMVALGRALMSDPRVLLLDEPTLGLSPLMAQELFAAVRQVKTLGVGILLAEQNAHASLAIADRGYVLATGRIVGAGTAQDLREDRAVQRAYLGGD